jgi:hypothetical protein
MRKKRYVLGMSVCVAMGIGLTAATPARADAPEIIDRPYGGSYVLADCGDFQLNAEFDGNIRIYTWYDDEGNRTLRRWHVSASEDIWNSETGFSVQNTFQTTTARDYESGETMNTGVGYRITVPGYGAVFFDAGRSVRLNGEQIELMGNVDQDYDELCEAMDQ